MIDCTFGRKIKDRRESKGLSIRALAGRASLARSTISNIENGANPSLITMFSLARGLELDLGALLGGESHTVSPGAAQALRLFTASSPDVQNAMLRLLDTVKTNRRMKPAASRRRRPKSRLQQRKNQNQLSR